jgi:hypothetical protein
MSRLTQLEDAHRALAAQHTALLEVCRAILPLIPAPPALVQQALVEVYDRTNVGMAQSGMDSAYQADVRRWLDALSADMTTEHHSCPSTTATAVATRSL